MTKKDFELIATSLRKSREDTFDFNSSIKEIAAVREANEHIAHNLALALATTNPQFDEDRFLKACGIK